MNHDTRETKNITSPLYNNASTKWRIVKKTLVQAYGLSEARSTLIREIFREDFEKQ